MGQPESLPPSLSLSPVSRPPSHAHGGFLSSKERARTFNNPVFRLLTGRDKGGLKLELFQLGKIGNVTFLMLCVLCCKRQSSQVIIFPDSSFPLSSSSCGPG